MTDETPPQSLSDDALLSRFLVRKEWIRQDGTARPDAFMPPESLELSVTKINDCTDREVWLRGQAVATARELKLCGRAEILASIIRSRTQLDAVDAPIPEDPMHAHIVGWPPLTEKAMVKSIAQELAAAAKCVRISGPVS